jgi:hypothetical protein
MKKSLIALALVTAMGAAFAEGTSVSIDYQKQSVDAGGAPDQNQYSLQVKQKISDLFAVDFGVSAAQTEAFPSNASKAFKDTTRVEAGVSAQKAIFGPVDGYARVGIGQKAPSGTEAFMYSSVEAGIVYHATPSLHAKLGYRVRNELGSVTSSQTDSNNTLRMALAYDLTKVDTIAINRDNLQANAANGGDQTAYHITYTRKF